MITLYQFPPIWGLPNASPFCLKMETWLRMNEIPYENRFVMDPRKSPKGKFPFIKIDGFSVADSELIIEYLKNKFGDVLDKHINAEQSAQALYLESVFSERLYWYMLYSRWQDDAGWVHIKDAFFARLPFLSKFFVPNMVRKATIKSINIQGTGKHSRKEILHLAYKTLDAIATTLGDHAYFAGAELTSVDATAFGFLANIVWQPYDCPLQLHLQKYKNIQLYCDKMWRDFYPEIKQPFAIV